MTRANRRCPLCSQETDEIRCPLDGMATLIRRPPKVDLDLMQPGLLVGGKYKLVQEIGRSGFGAVFRCTHIGTGQDVAVKILALPPGDDDTVFQRFFLEARSTAGLGHPNTLRVFDFGQDASGACYLVMELLDGQTLAEELRERLKRQEVFTEMEAVSIADSVLRSLAEAHEKGLIHRDIKPQNIFLHQVHGDDPVVKVLDFGIAHSTELAARQHPEQIPGTPQYMSPEQAKGLQVDGRSDLYSLGVVLYELVTGAPPPLDQETPQLRERAKVSLSDGFVTAVEQALALLPEHRWKDAAAMRQALMRNRGRVSGRQLAVRVSSSSLPKVSAQPFPTAPPPAGTHMPEITVNGVPMDAKSLQPRKRTRRLMRHADEIPGRQIPPSQFPSKVRPWIFPLLMLLLLVGGAALAWHLHQRAEELAGNNGQPAAPDFATDLLPTEPAPQPVVEPTPPTPVQLTPEPTPAALPPLPPPDLPPIQPSIPPPPIYGLHPPKAKPAHKGCDPFDPYCK